jgi:hypothetical protein
METLTPSSSGEMGSLCLLKHLEQGDGSQSDRRAYKSGRCRLRFSFFVNDFGFALARRSAAPWAAGAPRGRGTSRDGHLLRGLAALRGSASG